jgi:hypothetical protein
MGEMIRDNDILKRHFLAAKPKPDLPTSCTLGEEMLPPSERPSIQKMIVEGYRKEKENGCQMTFYTFSPIYKYSFKEISKFIFSLYFAELCW